MPAWICVTCGVQHADTPDPPEACAICQDERQYVGWEGQRWTTLSGLAQDHRNEIREEEPGLLGIGVSPAFAIGQRALLVCTPNGNVLWDCVPLLDESVQQEVRSRGGIEAICLSHPHFYSCCVEWAETFNAPVLVPTADREWICRPSRRIQLWSEDEVEVLPGLRLARIGGHFDGAAVLSWSAGADGRGALLTDDTITVVQDREWVSFMWSYPNLIPLDARSVQRIALRVERYRFDRIYGGWWGKVVPLDGPAAIRRSADRYVAHLAASAAQPPVH